MRTNLHEMTLTRRISDMYNFSEVLFGRVLFLLSLEIFYRKWRSQRSYISARATFYATFIPKYFARVDTRHPIWGIVTSF